MTKKAGDVVETVTAPFTNDLTNDPIDMVDLIGGGMIAPMVQTVSERLPFHAISQTADFVPNANILMGTAQLAGALVVGHMTKNQGKGATKKLLNKGGNITQVGLGVTGAANIVTGVGRTIGRMRGSGTKQLSDAQLGNGGETIWNTPWQMQ